MVEKKLLGKEPQEGFAFSGHQTFPFRQLWPYKAYHESISAVSENRVAFEGTESMLSLGVGANMVDSMKFWARAIGIIDHQNKPTDFGQAIFGEKDKENGLDPYCESTVSLWFFHWNLAKNQDKLTALWFLFNRFNFSTFTKEDYLEAFVDFLKSKVELGKIKKLPSNKTIERDVDTILRAYCPKTRDVGRLRKQETDLDNAEELSDDPLRELKLLSVKSNTYSFIRKNKSSINNALFAYCLLDFWLSNNQINVSLDFNKIAYEVGSVGKVFKLDEISLGDHLQQLSQTTNGQLVWSEQHGLRQVLCKEPSLEGRQKLQQSMLAKAYNNG